MEKYQTAMGHIEDGINQLIKNSSKFTAANTWTDEGTKIPARNQTTDSHRSGLRYS